MRVTGRFDPIEPGESDDIVFNFDPDVGAATMVSTSWACSFAGPAGANDPDPQSRITGTPSIATTIARKSPADGTLLTEIGSYSIARFAGAPDSAAGGVYTLDASMVLSDGRELKLNSTMACKAAGS